jgi:hypothetical protein
VHGRARGINCLYCFKVFTTQTLVQKHMMYWSPCMEMHYGLIDADDGYPKIRAYDLVPEEREEPGLFPPRRIERFYSPDEPDECCETASSISRERQGGLEEAGRESPEPEPEVEHVEAQGEVEDTEDEAAAGYYESAPQVKFGGGARGFRFVRDGYGVGTAEIPPFAEPPLRSLNIECDERNLMEKYCCSRQSEAERYLNSRRKGAPRLGLRKKQSTIDLKAVEEDTASGFSAPNEPALDLMAGTIYEACPEDPPRPGSPVPLLMDDNEDDYGDDELY